MAYVKENFKTKKLLKEWVKDGKAVSVFQPGPFNEPVRNGEVFLEGPHFPKAHTWYAKATVVDGKVTKVK